MSIGSMVANAARTSGVSKAWDIAGWDARKHHSEQRHSALVRPDWQGDGHKQQPAQVAPHDLASAHRREVCMARS